MVLQTIKINRFSWQRPSIRRYKFLTWILKTRNNRGIKSFSASHKLECYHTSIWPKKFSRVGHPLLKNHIYKTLKRRHLFHYKVLQHLPQKECRHYNKISHKTFIFLWVILMHDSGNKRNITKFYGCTFKVKFLF